MSDAIATTPADAPLLVDAKQAAALLSRTSQFDTIPSELQRLAQWVVWRWETRNGERTKPPYSARTGKLARANDPSTWATFLAAMKVVRRADFDGLGFVFSADDPYAGVDLDDCVDAVGTVAPWARKIIDQLDSYTEVSPSGHGVKVFVRGRLPKGRRRKGKVEMYDRERYFTITGQRLAGTPATVKERGPELKKLHAEIFPKREAASKHAAGVSDNGPDDHELIERAMQAKDGAKFRQLWNGNIVNYDSHSEADLALCGLLAFWVGPDPSRIDRLFRQSGLMRDKWEREDYREKTISQALDGKTEFYRPGAAKINLVENPPGQPQQLSQAAIPYRTTPTGLFYDKPTKDGSVAVPLTNFTVRIVADVAHDDGAEIRRVFDIEARIGERVRRFSVPVTQFAGLGWVIEHLGAQALVFPGYTVKDHTRAAIQLLSGDVPSRIVFAHTGWRQVDGQWVYLHAGGAIGPNGPVADIEVSLSGDLQRFALPEPPKGDELAAAIRSSLRLLDITSDPVALPIFTEIWRAAIGSCDHGAHLSGPTGAGKTAVAALAQQHYGRELDGRHLPGSWSSTGNALEAQAFTLKDTLFVVDDFAPQGTSADVQRLHREAARLIRAQGNRSGRQRMRADTTLRAVKPPRGLILSTGEDVPRGQSVRARLVVLEIGPDDLDWQVLSDCQRDATAGKYAQAMAGFVCWLADRYAQVRDRLHDDLAELRQRAAGSGQHRRTPEIVANLMFGLLEFSRFACEAEALSKVEAAALRNRAWAAFGEMAAAQAAHQAAAEPTRRFIELLSSAIADGHAHIAGSNGDAPTSPKAWGWRETTIGTGMYQRDEWQPQGHRVGWVDGNNLFLDPDASYRAAEAMAGSSADGLVLTPRTLWKRLHERGLLVTVEEHRRRLTVRQTIAGARRSVLHLRSASLVAQEVAQVAQSAHDPTQRAENSDLWADQWATSDDGQVKSGPENGPRNGPSAIKSDGAGPIGTVGTVLETGEAQVVESLAVEEREEVDL